MWFASHVHFAMIPVFEVFAELTGDRDCLLNASTPLRNPAEVDMRKNEIQ